MNLTALFNKGITLRQHDRLEEAIDCFHKILALQPNHVTALQALTEIHQDRNERLAAKPYLVRLVNLQPEESRYHIALSETYFHEHKLAEAEHHLRQGLDVAPHSPVALSNLGYILYLRGKLTEAEQLCTEAVSISPGFADARCNLGIIYLARNKQQLAYELFQQVVQQHPDVANGWLNFGIVLMNFGRLTESVDASRRALQLNPDLVEAYCNLGMALQEILRHEEAIIAYGKALEIRPYHAAAQSNRLMCMQYMDSLGSRALRETAADYRSSIQPFHTTSGNLSKHREKIRLGYLSGDLNQHPVGWFFQAALKARNRQKFEIFCYHDNAKSDDVSDAIRLESDNWHPVNECSDVEIIEQIRNDQIDILVDLAGHTAGNRLGVFAAKAAPLQLSWLGYFASTGLKSIDYVFISEDQIRPGCQAYFTEKLFALNQCQFCYTAPDYCPEPPPSPHITNGYLTFGSFNNTAKLNAGVLTLWSRILLSIPGSMIILKWKSFNDPGFCDKIRRCFAREGITPDRVLLRGASDHETMLKEYGDIDIALDPYPFSGALTTCEALWMGVPVVTLAQLRPVSRQSFSILKNLGLASLAAATKKEYLDIAVQLAHDSNRLEVLRSELRGKMTSGGQSHAEKLARELERGYLEILTQHG